MVSKKVDLKQLEETDRYITGAYSAKYLKEVPDVPKYELPRTGVNANIAYQLVHDEQCLDGNPFLNLASFVNTWMEPEADKLIMESINKNIIDIFEYPQTDKVIQTRIVNILARLFNAPEKAEFMGVATAGSSEAIMLGLLAHKWSWRMRREEEGKSYDKPNIVFGADAHVCWDKFAKYFDVEARKIPIEETRRIITGDVVRDRIKKGLIDENTICVGAILGTTFTGEIDSVEEINDVLLELKYDIDLGWDIPIHVDAASGGFILPFTEPDFEWDFRLEQVKSINVSGHKYGLTYPGLGWLIFRNERDLPKDLIFNVDYLGEEEETYTLNFSRGSAMVVAQYYNLLRFGRSGYTTIMNNILDTARYLGEKLRGLGRFEMLNEGKELPIIAFKLKEPKDYKLLDISYKIRERGWIVPAYHLPDNAKDIEIMRVVVRENFTCDMANILVDDIEKACKFMDDGGYRAKEKTTLDTPGEKYHIC
ncbi:MAG TPA: glutamate decarboxylase [Methanotrichaceae archaeon]|nr:glutamate decarboxylase [Methanotrichaceae archaeon]